MKNKIFIILIAIAILLKLSLFIFAELHAPQAKFLIDTKWYLDSAEGLADYGAFARLENSELQYEFYRTPGYPFFLYLFHFLFKVPLAGIIFLQIILSVAGAYFVYRTAALIDPRLSKLSALIILFDPAITIHSLLLLSETLFLFFISLGAWLFIKYLKENQLSALLWTALALVAATYVKPISYYLGFFLALFMFVKLSRTNLKKFLGHTLFFLLIVYVCLGIWQYRNYTHFKRPLFCSANSPSDVKSYGLAGKYAREGNIQGTLPLHYYSQETARCLLELLTNPGSFKYFNSDPLKKLGKVIGYPWIILVMIGFVAGLTKIKRETALQFLALIAFYFITTSILAAPEDIDSRFRIPMMPFAAGLSAYGWIKILQNNKGQANF